MEEGLLTESLLEEAKSKTDNGLDDNCRPSRSQATIATVLSTIVALFGSLSSGCILGYSSPAESGIVEDLELPVAAYSVFGSILTIGGMVGGLVNGRITDIIGRRGNAWWLDSGRLSLGFAAALNHYVVGAMCEMPM
ncbi:hypothetical protein FNV43_RR14909 [Rhamnella rubrinervis]|uniref:Major facilitator superfamily (MFS) profile domain-containing protein n=1 Tax=Rhamnella rubrinervis TaxID=2594499 RepID=A0A8K0H479_9ROSA|nr:hypothetical protein FNV43_RR14909 [Rhamnella rubrinervis]